VRYEAFFKSLGVKGLITAVDGMSGQSHAPAALPPGKETQYPLYRRLCEPQFRLDGCVKSRHPPGFDPRTFQPVASRCTD